jgi:heme/copper-type cytochrome/quinol oxidase subunit 2
MSDPMPAAAPAPAPDGKTLGIVGLVLAFLVSLAGLVVSLVAKSQSKKAGVPNGPATAGVVLSIIFLVIQLIILIVFIVTGAALVEACDGYGPGVHTLGGGPHEPSVTLTCG